MIVVLDTNVFYGDAGARRPLLTAVLDGAANGDFEVVVPEVVINELVRQYPERLREARKALTTALDTMRRLNIAPKDPPLIDMEHLIEEYEADLRRRFSDSGRRITPHPVITAQLAAWATARRKPFKSDGSGLADALIWGTVLELAPSDSVLFVTSNSKDFADKDALRQLAPELLRDLRDIRVGAAHVRLIPTIEQLVDEVVRPLASAEARAYRLLANPDRRARLINALVDATVYRPINVDEFDIGVELDSDPQAVGVGIDRVSLLSARESPASGLILSVEAIVDLQLELTIYKPDFYEAEDDVPHISVIDSDFNEHYLTAETELVARATWNVVTDGNARKVDVEAVAFEPADDADILDERLAAGARDSLVAALEAQVGWQLGNYIPEGATTPADDARIQSFHADVVEVLSVEPPEGKDIACSIRLTGPGEVVWHIAAPSAGDFTAGAETDSDVGLLQGVAAEPLELIVEGWVDNDLQWLQFAVVDLAVVQT